MFFGAYLGSDNRLSAWQEVMRQHAAWLGLSSHLSSRRLQDGHSFWCGWLSAPGLKTTTCVYDKDDWVLLTTSPNHLIDSPLIKPEPPSQWLTPSKTRNVIKLGLS